MGIERMVMDQEIIVHQTIRDQNRLVTTDLRGIKTTVPRGIKTTDLREIKIKMEGHQTTGNKTETTTSGKKIKEDHQIQNVNDQTMVKTEINNKRQKVVANKNLEGVLNHSLNPV